MSRWVGAPLVQLSLAKTRELIREPEAIFWVFIFPVLLALSLGIAFRASGPEELPIGVEQATGADWIVATLGEAPALRAELMTPETAREKLRTGAVALVVRPGTPWTYWYDPTRPDSRLARLAVDDALQRAAGRTDPHAVATEELTEKGSRYIDFLIPGLLGMNLMGTGMWGIGFSIVNARQKRLLKGKVATPMRRSHYLLSQMAGRMIFLLLEVGVLVGFAVWVFDVPVRGAWLTLAALCLGGALTFAGLGLLVAARPQTIEGVSGLMNFVMLPMWICSGTFFSTARFPDFMQPAIQALPLTAVNDALRGVMVEGASVIQLWDELAIAGFWAVACFAAAMWLFRWS
ncbi:MAG: ABC transporter permease [Acidobacteriota bacterium]|nr:MAG: ABC transporter permease [Acidobacteriota bacterium]